MSMNKLKRSGVVNGKVRPVTDAQHGGLLQLIIEQSHDAALAVFVERGRRFVQKDPCRLVQEKARKSESLLFAQRKLHVPALGLVELGNEIAEIAPHQGLSHIRIKEGVGRARITQGVA